jgi:hypothetical protein
LPLFVNGFAKVWPNRRRADARFLRPCNLIREGFLDMTELAGQVGFASPVTHQTFSKRRAGIELFATIALAILLAIAATAVSIGVAHAQALGAVTRHDGAPVAIAACLGLAILGAAGLTAAARAARRPRA